MPDHLRLQTEMNTEQGQSALSVADVRGLDPRERMLQRLNAASWDADQMLLALDYKPLQAAEALLWTHHVPHRQRILPLELHIFLPLSWTRSHTRTAVQTSLLMEE